MICPCKDCDKKGCGDYHSQCKPYLEYSKWKKDMNERERKLKLIYAKSNAKRRNKWKREI
jgi:hypothetical protein